MIAARLEISGTCRNRTVAAKPGYAPSLIRSAKRQRLLTRACFPLQV
jgi:hypothetical protein